METTLLALVAITCLPLTALGLRSMFAPSSIGKAMSITPEGSVGLNTIRGVLGGLFLASVSMLGLGIAMREGLWFMAVSLLMGVVILGRLVGIAVDGFDRAVVPPLVVELVIGGVLLAAALLITG